MQSFGFFFTGKSIFNLILQGQGQLPYLCFQVLERGIGGRPKKFENWYLKLPIMQTFVHGSSTAFYFIP